jgi:hypothetical protein
MSDPTTMSTPEYIRWLNRELEKARREGTRAEAENAALQEQLEVLQSRNTVLELERNMAIGRARFWWGVMSRTARAIGMDHPEARCVICMEFLLTVPHLHAVFAGMNEDGSRRFMHHGCWSNMRDYLRSSFGVLLDDLAEQKLRQQSGKPELGSPPDWLQRS